jgi:hypothetical protein
MQGRAWVKAPTALSVYVDESAGEKILSVVGAWLRETERTNHSGANH